MVEEVAMLDIKFGFVVLIPFWLDVVILDLV